MHQVQPRNYLLFACHAFNVAAQANQMRRAIEYKVSTLDNPQEELTKIGTKIAGAVGVAAAAVAAVGPLKRALGASAIPATMKDIVMHPGNAFVITCISLLLFIHHLVF